MGTFVTKTPLFAAALITVSLALTRGSGASPATSTGAIVSLRTPGALAVSPDGGLYVVDSSRDQILQRLSNGQFQVVAGNGRRGFSGDGRLAVDAKISVTRGSDLVVASDGTMYFTDGGNQRVREIFPNGIIQTVAGGGTETLGTAPVSALRADFGQVGSLYSLAISPAHQLYIGTNGVYRLDAGMLHWVVGSYARRLNTGFKGFGMNPVVQKDFVPAETMSFDAKGDLLVGGGGSWGLYERTATGKLRFLEYDRAPGGLFASMTTASDGSVLIAGGAHGLARFHPSGRFSTVLATGLSTVLPPPSHFTVGEGIAVTHNGTVYLDTDGGNGFSNVSAIVQVTSNGHTTLVWES